MVPIECVNFRLKHGFIWLLEVWIINFNIGGKWWPLPRCDVREKFGHCYTKSRRAIHKFIQPVWTYMRMYVRNGPSVIICCTFFSAVPLSREYLEHVYLYTQHSGPNRREDLIKTLPTNSWPHGALSQRCARLPGSMEVIMQAPLTSW